MNNLWITAKYPPSLVHAVNANSIMRLDWNENIFGTAPKCSTNWRPIYLCWVQMSLDNFYGHFANLNGIGTSADHFHSCTFDTESKCQWLRNSAHSWRDETFADCFQSQLNETHWDYERADKNNEVTTIETINRTNSVRIEKYKCSTTTQRTMNESFAWNRVSNVNKTK